jgi:transcriptional regulator of arginine metabolism
METKSSAKRREAIRGLIRQRRIGSQDDLRRELHKLGFDTTQATLSRDLTVLEARRVAGSDGSFYELEGSPVAPSDKLSECATMVDAVAESHALVVVMTAPGAASLVASYIDRARWSEVLGTIAGDDTVFIAPSKRIAVKHLADKLRARWKKGTP